MKSGIISASGSDSVLTADICPASQRQSSLGSVCNDILENKSGAVKILVFLAAGVVYVATGTSGGTATDTCVFEPVAVPPSLKSLSEFRANFTAGTGLSGFTMGSLTDTVQGASALGGMIKAVLDPVEYQFNFGRFVDAMDDAFQASDIPPAEVVIVLDQTGEEIDVLAYSAAPTASSPTATFTRTAITAGDALFGG